MWNHNIEYLLNTFIEINFIIYIEYLVPNFAGSNPAEVVRFFGRNNPQHAFLRRESKAVDPMS